MQTRNRVLFHGGVAVPPSANTKTEDYEHSRTESLKSHNRRQKPETKHKKHCGGKTLGTSKRSVAKPVPPGEPSDTATCRHEWQMPQSRASGLQNGIFYSIPKNIPSKRRQRWGGKKSCHKRCRQEHTKRNTINHVQFEQQSRPTKEQNNR